MHLCCYLEIRINCVYYCICYLQEIQYSFLGFFVWELWTLGWKSKVIWPQDNKAISDLSHTLFITPHIYYTIPTKLKMQFRIAPYVLVMKCSKSGLLGWYFGYKDQQRFGLWDQADLKGSDWKLTVWVLNIGILVYGLSSLLYTMY